MRPTFVDEKTLQTRDLILFDVCHITVSNFGFCKTSVLVENRVDVPACDMAQHSYSAASTMLESVSCRLPKVEVV